jgi:hypothetical protein
MVDIFSSKTLVRGLCVCVSSSNSDVDGYVTALKLLHTIFNIKWETKAQ